MDGVCVLRRTAAEVRVLVVSGRHRNVELAGSGEKLTFGRDEDRGVESQSVLGLTALVQRCVDEDLVLGGGFGGEGESGSGEQVFRFASGIVAGRGGGGVAAERQLRKKDHGSAQLRCGRNALAQFGVEVVLVLVPAMLHETYTQRCGRGRRSRGQRLGWGEGGDRQHGVSSVLGYSTFNVKRM